MSNTTTSTAKDLVLKWVRSKNPQTMELKFGCIFQFKKGFVTPSDGEVLPERYCNRSFFLLSHSIRDDNPWQTADVKKTVLTFCCPDSMASALALTIGTEIPMSYFKEHLNILGSDMGLQELLIALCSLGAHSEIGDWKAQGTINRVLAFYNEGGKALFNYDLGQNLHNQHPNFYQYVLPLIS